MHLIRSAVALAVLAAAFSPDSQAGEPRGPAPKPAPAVDPEIQKLAFMAGDWVSAPDGRGGSEEIWSAPMGVCMAGVFRQVRPDGNPLMFELLTLTREFGGGDTAGVFMRLRHHSPILVSREEKDAPVVLKLKMVEPGHAVFKPHENGGSLDHIAYAARGDDGLAIEVAFTPQSKKETLRFDMQRRKAARSAAAPIPADTASALFDRFNRLEGPWRGKSTRGWTETITYKTIAGGSCVMETSFDAHPNEMMTTMFTLDADRLLLTHYCVAKNQPRLVATQATDDGAGVTFTFLDATGLGSKGRDTGHMDKVVFKFTDDDRFTSRWTWYQDGKESWLEEIEHERVKGSEPLPVPSSPTPTHHHE